jgi:AmmeMemoRadiSam system protein A
LTVPERGELLRLARDSIAASLRRSPSPHLATPTPSQLAPNGVFVSLHMQAELRGCVGTLTTDRPLHQSVSRLAVVAAFDDPRFPPLREPELSAICIEISRLTTPIPVTPDALVVGRDGVCVAHGEHRAVLLPQVAPEHGWDAERLLREVCRKAQLPEDVWRLPDCEILRFEAECFSDRTVEA